MSGGLSDCFTVGSSVSCVTCYNKRIEGQVLAFDPHTKILILKCPSSNGRPSSEDVSFVNLSLVSNISVTAEAPPAPVPPISLNVDKISTRLRNQLEEKKRMITAFNSGVSPEGQQLFYVLSKTVREVAWRGENIIVYNNLVITPPYKTENLKGPDSEKMLVRKIIEKHLKDSGLQPGN